MEERPRFLTVAQVQEELGLGRWAVLALLRKGRLPAFKAGGRWLVERDDLEAFIEREKRRRAGEPEFEQIRLPI